MANLVLFETTESIIEVLWDIALAFFIVRLAFIYFLLTLASGAAITYISQLLPLPASLLTPFLLLLSAISANFLVSHYDIPPVSGFRLAIGCVAGMYMMLAECVLGLGLGKAALGLGQGTGYGTMMACLAGFSSMPLLLMLIEKREAGERKKETWHGHEEKSVVDAV
jgi:hypothetical protein